MTTEEFVPLSQLGVVRNHREIEKFAEIFVKLGAISPETAISSARVVQEVGGGTPRGVYNKLKRPGFVQVNNGLSNARTYYYLFNEGFGDLAKEQGHQFYPEHLAPLVVHGYIPKVLNRNKTFNAPMLGTEVIGTVTAALPDTQPLTCRALGMDDNIISELPLSGLPELVRKIVNDPLNTEASLDNVLVLLSGVKRWRRAWDRSKANEDFERKTWLETQLKKNSEG